MMTLLFASIVALVFALLLPGRRSVSEERRRAVQRGAARIEEEMAAVYGGEHEYREVSPGEFPHLDIGFYDRAAAELERCGFRRIADIEDLTLSRAHPHLRTFIRTMLDEAGLIRVAIVHMRPRGLLVWLLQAARLVPRHIKLVELVTEAPAGRFLSTAPTKGVDHMTPPAEFLIEKYPIDTPIRQLLERHRERLQELVAKEPHLTPVYLADLGDLLASVQRGNIILSRFRQQIGGLTREELEHIAARPLSESDEELLREVRRRQQARAAADEPSPEST